MSSKAKSKKASTLYERLIAAQLKAMANAAKIVAQGDILEATVDKIDSIMLSGTPSKKDKRSFYQLKNVLNSVPEWFVQVLHDEDLSKKDLDHISKNLHGLIEDLTELGQLQLIKQKMEIVCTKICTEYIDKRTHAKRCEYL